MGGCVSTRNVDEVSSMWAEYADRRHGFSLSHPRDWQVVRGVTGLLASIAAPEEDDAGFRSNLNVVRRIQDTALDLDGLARTAVSSLVRVLNDVIVIDVDTAVVADHPARRLLLAHRQGIYALTCEQWLLLAGDHIWTVSAGAATDVWDEVADTFGRIAHSLALKAPAHA